MNSSEREVILTLERLEGRKLSAAEVYLALEQARAVGDIPAPERAPN